MIQSSFRRCCKVSSMWSCRAWSYVLWGGGLSASLGAVLSQPRGYARSSVMWTRLRTHIPLLTERKRSSMWASPYQRGRFSSVLSVGGAAGLLSTQDWLCCLPTTGWTWYDIQVALHMTHDQSHHHWLWCVGCQALLFQSKPEVIWSCCCSGSCCCLLPTPECHSRHFGACFGYACCTLRTEWRHRRTSRRLRLCAGRRSCSESSLGQITFLDGRHRPPLSSQMWCLPVWPFAFSWSKSPSTSPHISGVLHLI